MDVDGTLTNGKIYIGDSGEIFKAFNIKDGCGIHDLAIPHGIMPIIITGRRSQIVLNRCQEIGISSVYQGANKKEDVLKEIIKDYSEAAYIGDDINDLECMLLVKNGGGIIGCPKNASNSVKKMATYISHYDGGDGAVREFIEWILDDFDLA